MEIERLREFVTLAIEGKLSLAAKELYISPSALSQHITALEKEIGCKLFVRSGGFKLSEKGEIAFDHAQKILSEYGAMLHDCSSPLPKNKVELNVPNFQYCLQPLLKAREEYLAVHPDFEVVFSINSREADNPFDVLDSGASDVSMLFIVRGSGHSIQEVVPQGFSYIFLEPQRCIFLSSASHPLAKKEILTADDLNGATLVSKLSSSGSKNMSELVDVLESYGARTQLLLRKADNINDLLMNDLGSSFVVWRETVGEESKTEANLATLGNFVIHRFEHEIISDAYMLYRRDKLDEFQLEFLGTVESIYSVAE